MSDLSAAISLGIRLLYERMGEPQRDPIAADFAQVQRFNLQLKRGGDGAGPDQRDSSSSRRSSKQQEQPPQDVRFWAYAPLGFAHLRRIRKIPESAYVSALCESPIRETTNPGKSGAKLFFSEDRSIIFKTISQHEHDFLLRLLTSYYNEISKRPGTLLPVFIGLYHIKTERRRVILIAMQNIFHTTSTISERYDLKGSTYKRSASSKELAKSSPTLKDLDWVHGHKHPVALSFEAYTTLSETLAADLLYLRSFGIMDYSMLVGVSYRTKAGEEGRLTPDPDGAGATPASEPAALEGTLDGRRVRVFMGIIDVLQPYGRYKRMEYFAKRIIHDSEAFSVNPPGNYLQRFQTFMLETVVRVEEQSDDRAAADRLQQRRRGGGHSPGPPSLAPPTPASRSLRRRSSAVDCDPVALGRFLNTLRMDAVVLVPDATGQFATVVGKPTALADAVKAQLPKILAQYRASHTATPAVLEEQEDVAEAPAAGAGAPNGGPAHHPPPPLITRGSQPVVISL